MCPLFRNLSVGDACSGIEEIASCACINDRKKLLRYINIHYCLYYMNDHLNVQSQLDMAGMRSLGIVTYTYISPWSWKIVDMLTMWQQCLKTYRKVPAY